MNPGRFFGGAPGGQMGWGVPPLFPQMMPQMPPDRLERWNQIGPVFPYLKDGLIPTNIPVPILENLLSMIKEEGNACFKDKNYTSAYDMYTCALHICKNLQTEHFVNVNRELLSTIFSNRAACLLKMDFFKESIQDCEIAVQQNCDNIKAHFRMAMAYKSLRDYGSALDSARKGKQQALSAKKSKEVKEFEDLICEVESHMPSQEKEKTSVPFAQTGSLTVAASVTSTRSSQSKPVAGKNFSFDQPQSKLKTDDRKKNTGGGGSKTDDLKKAGSKVGTAKVDKSNFDDAASANAKKKQSAGAPKKKVKKKVIPKKSPYQGKFAMLSKEASESDDGTDNAEPDKDSTDTSESFEDSPVQAAGAVEMGLDDFEDISWKMQASPRKDMVGSTNIPDTKFAYHRSGYDSNKTQNDKLLNSNIQSQHQLLSGFPSSTVQQRLNRNSGNLISQPTEYISSPSSYQQANNHSIWPVPSYQQQQQAAALNPSFNMVQNSSRGDFTCINTRIASEFPFDGRYDLALVCDQCYLQNGIGHAGYICLGHLEHKCSQNVFLIRPKINPEKDWIKIRPRNQKVKFLGPFRICRDYVVGQRCRISENDCTFAHSEEEARLWTLDRERQFELDAFISRLQSHVQKSKAPGYDAWKPNSGMTFTNSAYDQTSRDSLLLQQPKETPFTENYGLFNQGIYEHGPLTDVGHPGNEYLVKNFNAPPGMTNNFGGVPAMGTSTQQIKSSATGTDSVSWAKAAAPKEFGKNHQQIYQKQDLHPVANKMPFPLFQACNFRLVCTQCLISLPGTVGYHWWNSGLQHSCAENIFAVQPKASNVWVRIRERVNHREFFGNYVLCWHFTSGKVQACRRQDTCPFAHNAEEQFLWTLEKDGQFNISEFIRQNRSQSAQPLFTIGSVLEKYPGEIRHICGSCYHLLHLLSIQNPADSTKCMNGGHAWQENKILIHFSENSVITDIGQRPFTSKTAYFRMCHHQRFCRMRNIGKCMYAHSVLERDLWCLERDLGLTEDQIVEEAARIVLQKYTGSTSVNVEPTEQPQQPAKSSTKSSVNLSVPVSPTEQADSTTDASTVSKCPFRVIEACRLCFEKGNMSSRKKDRCDGPGMGHLWGQNKMCIILPLKKKMSDLPKIIPRNLHFTICRHMLQKKKCDIGHGGRCQFAHSQEEIEVWTWMVKNQVRTLDELVSSCQKAYETPSAATKPIPKGQSVIAISGTVPSLYKSPLDLVLNAHYCHYCSVHCNSQKQWDEHCASDKHMFNVNSDREHQWNYRQPPWGIGGCAYELCDKHVDGGKCEFSEVPDMYNHCKFAHSREELDEWKERWEWRQMKREIAKQEHLYSYMAALREEFETADRGITVITEEIDGITVKCSTSLHIFEQKKNTTHTWVFEVHAGKQKLNKVALLYDQDRLHFTLHGPDLDKGCQIAPGEVFLTNGNVYKVEVKFNCGIFGSFSQLVVFDFGEHPVLGKRVNAELGTQFVQDKVKTLREKLKFDRWTSDNREVIWFNEDRRTASDLSSEMLVNYKTPSSADAVVTQQTVGVELNRHNYLHKMHKLLQIEELTQARIISRFNLQVEITVSERIIENGFVNARSGELFARVPLTDQLNEDTDAGHLILSGVTTVLLAPMDRSDRVVYEAIFVQKENFDYSGHGRDHVYLCLSARCCEAMNLNNGDSVEVEIQFQLNRLTFCQMHYAVDQLQNTDVVFPDISRVSSICDEKQFKLSSTVLNEDQMKIIQYIVEQKEDYNPPLVIYGPFGTGKTETLAQAAMALAKHESSARILICTHSNSAADLYILRHFDAFIKQSCPTLKLLRIYYKERRTNTVQAPVLKYCIMSDDRTRFLEPSRQDILNHQVVVTTLVTSLVLTKKELNLKGYFTHIFIDEAAQVLECETIMPLSLATESSSIVLAGDYNQMAQKVYSKEALRQRFHRSLVHRLFDHYKTYAHMSKDALPNVLLKNNYRTKMEILRFLSAVFYGGPDQLLACSTQPAIDNMMSLTFYTAFGREKQDADSTSYYNIAEIEEIVERVSELYNNWPKEWEEPAAESILVVTPYLDQVIRIRSALKKKNSKLGRVQVDRVSNVQGTEFRAVFINTVRTQHLAEDPPRIPPDASECDGEFGDFGFLSDRRLLNTAFTRSRSFVAVVGDPVALCAIGECMTIWRTYLKHCQNMKTIHPSSVTLETIKSRVQSLLNSPVCGPNLQKLSVLHQEAASGKLILDHNNKSMNEADTDFSNLKPDPNPFESVTLKGIFEDWSLDYHIEPDSIIQHLAEEAVLLNRVGQPQMEEPLKLECIRMHDRGGHATVQVVSTESPKQSRHLLTADDSNKDYDSDVDNSEDENDTAEATVYVDYMPHQLKELLSRQPDRFKHCILKIENSCNMYAKLLNCTSPCKQIKISSRLRCGRAFDNDEVVVEILPSDPEDAAAMPEDEKQLPQGQVIGVLRRAINPRYRMFVCMVDEENSGLMVPINRSIPKIYNLEPSEKAKKGHVCVYTFTKDKQPVFHHHEPIDPFNPGSKLFIVRYLKWEAKFYAPLGIVVGVLPAGVTIDQAMRILNIEHYIPKNFKDDTLGEIKRLYPSSFKFSSKDFSERTDYRGQMTITVDPSSSKDLDDAISIEDLSNGNYVIGIHVSDVSHFVRKDGFIDVEAEKRGVTLYPFACDPIMMLPDRLSTDLCSLLPGKDRLTLSVFITIDAKVNIQKVQIKRSIICSKHRLDYAQVEAIIKHQPLESLQLEIPETLYMNLLLLHRVAQIWRRRRLGVAALYHRTEQSSSTPDSPEAHLMVEELMITANHHVAMHLIERFPVTVPLRCQLAPDSLELDEWKQKFVEEAKNTVALTQPFKHRGEVCNCVGSCECIPETADDSVLVDIRKSTWEEIQNAVVDDEGDMDRLTSLIICPENHPKTTLAMLNLFTLNNQSQYVCSGDISQDEQYHHSVNISVYTHFTSPIRRYIDIVVHRLLKASLDEQKCPYSQSEIAELCNSCTEANVRARRYEQAIETLHYAKLFQEKPVVLNPVVEEREDALQLRFPLLKVLSPQRTRIRFSHLSLSEKPTSDEEGQLQFKWSKRIYDRNPKRQQLSTSYTNNAVLDGNKYILQTTASDWREVLWNVISGDKDKTLMSLMQVAELLIDSSQDDRLAVDVTSEGAIVISGRQFCDFSLVLYSGSVVQVQLASELVKGMIVPTLQLFNLTPTLNICMEHRVHATTCFTGTVTLHATKKSYRSVDAYRTSWLPVLGMEAAHNAVLNDDTVFIHNVGIVWEEKTMLLGKQYVGSFDVPIRFCKQRQIKFKVELESDDVENLSVENEDDYFQHCHGYLCVQYLDVTIEKPKSELPAEKLFNMTSLQATWVGHCIVSKVSLTLDRQHYRVDLRLHQSTCPIPVKVLEQSQIQQPFLATIEWILKPLPFCRMEDALHDLKSANQLAIDIALGKNPQQLDDQYWSIVDQWKNFDLPVLPAPNQVQKEAILRALRQPFTLIQGPPGTGKTVVGVQLAYLFTMINRSSPASNKLDSIRPQVLCCGPSNKSVDVLAGYLLQLKEQCPKLVRIYSESIEREEFPTPQDLVLKNRRFKADVVPEDLKSIALHHKIRNSGINSAYILEVDKQIRASPNSVELEDIKDYLQAISSAEREILREAEIILCTCSTSGASRIKYGTNIAQLVLDESGMCMEPESFISIVGSKPNQVVLLGDHKQLQPIVMESTARNRGLTRSLFERYADKAITLTVQYRMHESIAEFPSKYFYHDQLKVGKDEQTKPSTLKFWPNGRNKPMAFVHVMGIEQALTVATADGSEQSRSNAKEVDVTVRIANLLVRRFHVPPKGVAVLSQYRAQCAEIEKELLKRGEKDITVSTVVAAQGSEWEYVILSTVRSLPKSSVEKKPTKGWKQRNLGFITDAHQINVALTRAKKGLIIIGNKYLLQCDDMWKKLLRHYDADKKIVDAADFMS